MQLLGAVSVDSYEFTNRIGVAAGVSLGMIVAVLPVTSAAQTCPPTLDRATRLVVATTPTPDDKAGRLRMYARAGTSAPWRPDGSEMPMVVGIKGLAWGWTADGLARSGEPMKREGDKRAPAGVFEISRPFGIGPSSLPGYLRLRRGETFCVDDVHSPHYGRIVNRARAGRDTSGEDMATIRLYRRGLVVDYPPNAARRAGSCIFIHVWRRPTSGTLGCIATSETNVQRLQAFVSGHHAALAILPETARARLGRCLPR